MRWRERGVAPCLKAGQAQVGAKDIAAPEGADNAADADEGAEGKAGGGPDSRVSLEDRRKSMTMAAAKPKRMPTMRASRVWEKPIQTASMSSSLTSPTPMPSRPRTRR